MDKPIIIDLDLKGKTCPLPVVETRRAMQSVPAAADEVIITAEVDNSAAAANVSRFAESQSFTANREELDGGIFRITLTRGYSCDLPAPESTSPADGLKSRYNLYLDGPCMARGDEKLGRILMKAFLKTLPELDGLPDSIICVNQGVFLALDDSPELDSLKSLAGAGCKVLVCGTCLDFYGIKDKLAVGQVSNMFEIAGLLCGPERVVKP